MEFVDLNLENASIVIHPFYDERLQTPDLPNSGLSKLFLFQRAVDMLFCMQPIILQRHGKKKETYILVGGITTYWIAIVSEIKRISVLIHEKISEEKQKEMILIDCLIQPMVKRLMFSPEKLISMYDKTFDKCPTILSRVTGNLGRDKIWEFTGVSKSKGQLIRRKFKTTAERERGCEPAALLNKDGAEMTAENEVSDEL